MSIQMDDAKIRELFSVLEEEDHKPNSAVINWGAIQSQVLETENFELEKFLSERTNQYNIFINGGCNFSDHTGYYTAIVYYNEHSKSFNRRLETETSAFSSIYSGLSEVLPHLRISNKTVNIISAQALTLGGSSRESIAAIRKTCEEKQFDLKLYRFKENANNTIREILGMPLKPGKKK